MLARGDRSLEVVSGTLSRRRRNKLVADIGGREFVLRDDDLSELVTFSEDYRTEWNGIGGYEYSSDYSVGANLAASMMHRRILEHDPHFDMVCYIEVQCNVSRDASGRSVGRNTTGEWEITTTGGDKDPAPPRPVADLVVSVGGSVKFRAPIPAGSNTRENEVVAFDSAFPYENVRTWSVVRMKGGAEFLVNYSGFCWGVLRSENTQGTNPVTRVTSEIGYLLGPDDLIGLAGADYLSSKYAKDPRTGGGVLHIKSPLVDFPFSRTFLVTPGRAVELAAVVPSIAPETITTVAPT